MLIALAAVAVAGVLVRLPTIAEPMGIDQGFWASTAEGLSRGQILYRDLWDQKPPGMPLLYLAAFRVFGWTTASVVWIDLSAAAATAWLLYVVVRRIGGAMMGAVTAALYATLTIPAWLYSHGGILERSVAETFIGVCVGIAAWCATRLRRRSATPFAIGLGLALGAAVMLKPNAGLYFPALLLWIALYREGDAPASAAGARRRVVRTFVVAAIAALVVPVLMGVWLWSHGVLPAAKIAVVDFNRMYVAEGFTLRSFAIKFAKAVYLRMKTDPLWAAGACGVLVAAWQLARTKRLDPVPALAVLWGGAAALVIIANGHNLFNSYFIQAFPPLAVLTAWLITGVRRSRVHALGAWVAVAVMLVLLATRNYPLKVYGAVRADIDQLAGRSNRSAYLDRFGTYGNGHYSARANAELAAYLRAHTTRADLIYQFGMNDSGVYFDADRLPAQRFLRVNMFVPATKFADPSFQLAAVTQALETTRPLYLIFERLQPGQEPGDSVNRLRQQPEIVRLLESYHLETQIEDFTLYRRLD